MPASSADVGRRIEPSLSTLAATKPDLILIGDFYEIRIKTSIRTLLEDRERAWYTCPSGRFHHVRATTSAVERLFCHRRSLAVPTQYINSIGRYEQAILFKVLQKRGPHHRANVWPARFIVQNIGREDEAWIKPALFEALSVVLRGKDIVGHATHLR